MTSTPDRLNRSVFTVLGLILLVAGVYGLLRGYGVFGDTAAQESLLTGRITGLLGRIGDLFWPLMALLFLIIAYLAWRWLRAQLTGNPSVSEVDLTRDPEAGRTRLSASSATAALTQDIQGDPAVRSAKAKMVENGRDPDVDLQVEVAEDADLEGIRRRIEEEALVRFARAIQAEQVKGHLRFGLSSSSGRSVR